MADLYGTSPRLWGDFFRCGGEPKDTRYIPTLVGRLLPSSCLVRCRTVHPHACGEIVRACQPISCKGGTSPRLWGDCVVQGKIVHYMRYIPTLVGRFGQCGYGVCVHAVHPHACGEISYLKLYPNRCDGTSPRLWGDFLFDILSPVLKRYIPTLVGRFMTIVAKNRHTSVHPHACGEIGTDRPFRLGRPGTSPRLWGDLPRRKEPCALLRYIPTLVGRFLVSQTTDIRQEVHPHACGEIGIRKKRPGYTAGTSPRLWGD